MRNFSSVNFKFDQVHRRDYESSDEGWYPEDQETLFHDKYEKIDGEGGKLGEVGFFVVHKYRRKKDGREVAVKIVKFNQVIFSSKEQLFDSKKFKKEYDVMKDLDYHPNFVKVHEAYDFGHEGRLVMEFCPDGELLDATAKAGHFTEDQARHIYRQMVEARNCFRKWGIVHQDLKRENFLVDKKNSDDPMDWHVKLIDVDLVPKGWGRVFFIYKKPGAIIKVRFIFENELIHTCCLAQNFHFVSLNNLL